jgi:hypothetical protein
MNLFEQIMNEVVTPFLEPRIKKTSLKAVKGYVTSVQVARKIAITSYGISAVVAAGVAGIILMIVAIIGLLPIEPQAALIAMLVLGAVLTLAAAILTRIGFNEAAWLEKSKANDMMAAAMNPWPTAYSVPDPRAVFARGSETRATGVKSSLQPSTV